MQNSDDCFDSECTFWVNFVNKARGKSADMHPADRNTWHWNEAAALDFFFSYQKINK